MLKSVGARPRVTRAKISIPRLPAAGLERTRLLRSLPGPTDTSGGPDRGHVIEVCAPAGYGKSTLLAQYARALQDAGQIVAWVACDRHDADPARWWTAVLSALSAAASNAGLTEPTSVFDGLEPPRTCEPAFMAEFVEAVEELATGVTLVVDDLHELPDGEVRETLADLLGGLPPNLQLVLGTRRDLGLPLHRLKLDGRLIGVRAEALRFDLDEVTSAVELQGIALPRDVLHTLWQRTEGWPAATRLAILALVEQDAPAEFVARFAGDERGVAEYLVAEILHRLPDDIVRFLLDVCVAEELSGELAGRLSGRADAGAILERLEQANALVQRLGGGGDWYRFHSLLRSYLQAELRRRDLVAARAQHRRAARWFIDADDPDAALEHAVAAADDDLVVSLLTGHGLRLLLAGGGRRLRELLASCSPGVLADPEVTLVVALVALEDGDLVGGDEALSRFRKASPEPPARLCRFVELVETSRARLHGDIPRAIAMSSAVGSAEWSAGPEGVHLELLMRANRAAVRIAAGDYRDARDDLEAALGLARHQGLDHLVLDCLNQLAGSAAGLSEVADSRRWAEQAIAFARERGWGSSPRLAYAHMLAAWSAHLMLDVEDAAKQAAVSLALLQGGRVSPEVDAVARSGEAVIAFDRLPERPQALRRLRWLWDAMPPDERPSPGLVAFAALGEVRMSLELGERDHAMAVVRRVVEALPDHGDSTVMAALTVVESRPQRAAAAVAPVLAGERPALVVTTRITAWLVLALADAHAQRPEATHRALLAALDEGERTGVKRAFYDMGAPVRDLLVALVGRAGRREQFLGEVLTAWTAARAWQQRTAENTSVERAVERPAELAAPLTGREIELLRDLPSMLTTEGIATEHTLSVNTVKSHLRSLYRKLGVNTRRDAVLTARRMSLL
ncbi:LuxR C-terminal-related transcriptional regulator [Actinomycetospora flava]|uniref:LuxR C-terminal-related transcriptional regulator n=1 Tax=Actinomycetospora flava TaxID=3129232 RepID=A0ABU8MEP6_9PSEU